jgi:methylenetetrahydrofolate reductase (NADPH)
VEVDVEEVDRQALRALVANPIYELIPLEGFEEQAAVLPPRVRVTVTASPRLGIEATLSASGWLSARGHDVTPHLAARMIRDRAHLADVIERSRTAGLRHAFVVGGDAGSAGDFTDGLTLIRALDDMDHPFVDIGVPSYPEGHPHIPAEALLRDLREKQQHPLVRTTTTQMSFNPSAVASWIEQLRDEHITLDVHLGIPGAVELGRLIRIGTKIGVANSTRYLLKHRGLIGHLAQRGSFGPDAFLKGLAGTVGDPIAGIRALHVFTMNQVAATLAWQNRMLEDLAA